ncbi:MAG: hypothetical protein HC927_02515 [Deltaproteobacteria bacterium]|nr:hypothetical protein [Deltaproteobacteria bacterium]
MTAKSSAKRELINRKGDDPKKHPNLFERESHIYLALLPGGRVSISTSAEAAAEDRELSGIYLWE